MAFQTGIYNALLNDPQLMQLLPTQIIPNTSSPAVPIFYARIPPGIRLPMLMFFTTGGPQPDWTFEPDYVEPIDFQVSMWSEIPDMTEQMAMRVDAVLTWKPIVFDNVRNMAVFRTSPIDNLILEPAADESDQDVWMIALLYEAWLIRQLGS